VLKTEKRESLCMQEKTEYASERVKNKLTFEDKENHGVHGSASTSASPEEVLKLKKTTVLSGNQASTTSKTAAKSKKNRPTVDYNDFSSNIYRGGEYSAIKYNDDPSKLNSRKQSTN